MGSWIQSLQFPPGGVGREFPVEAALQGFCIQQESVPFPIPFLTLTKSVYATRWVLFVSCVSLLTVQRCTCEHTEKWGRTSWHHMYFAVLPSFYSHSKNVLFLLTLLLCRWFMLLWFSSRTRTGFTWSSCASVCNCLSTEFKKPSPYFPETEKAAFPGLRNKAYRNWNISTHAL